MDNTNKRTIRGVVDRFEGNYAVINIENTEGETLDLPGAILPEAAEEGSMVDISIKVKPNRTREAKRKVQEMIDRLKMKG